MILGSVLFSTSLTHKLRYGQHKQRLEAKLSVLDLLDVLIFDWKLGAFILERSMSWNFPVTYAFCQCFNLCIICQHEVNETEGFHFLHFPLDSREFYRNCCCRSWGRWTWAGGRTCWGTWGPLSRIYRPSSTDNTTTTPTTITIATTTTITTTQTRTRRR